MSDVDRPFVVGLTGGVASGKTTIARLLEMRGAAVIDADEVTRALVAPGEPALAEIVAAFGPEVLDGDGRLDRRAMRRRIFEDADARRRLEAILHPRVEAHLRAWMMSLSPEVPYAVLVIPLLVEAGRYDWIDVVVVVDVNPEVQRERLVQRDRITPSLADAMIAAQATREARRAVADVVLDNSGDRDAAVAAVEHLHADLLRRARAGRATNRPSSSGG